MAGHVTGRWFDTEILSLIATDLHDSDIDYNLRGRLVDVVDNLLRQQNLVRSTAHHNGLLGDHLLNSADF